MQTFNIHQAKTNLSQLIQMALDGQNIIIAKSGKPIIKLEPIKEKLLPRKPGAWKSKIKISKDFDELPEDLLEMFTNPQIEPK